MANCPRIHNGMSRGWRGSAQLVTSAVVNFAQAIEPKMTT